LPKSNKDKNLHGQIEDLLTALSEMQRDHAILATQLQREREEREEDRVVVKSLLDALKLASNSTSDKASDSETVTIDNNPEKNNAESSDDEHEDSPVAQSASVRDSSLEDVGLSSPRKHSSTSLPETNESVSALLDKVELRFERAPDNRRSSMLQSKSQLREELARSKEQLIIETSKSQDFSRRLSEQEQEIHNLKDQVREGHTHIRNAHQEKQRLEKQIHDLRIKKTPATTPDSNDWKEPDWRGSGGGLRELKLGRANSKTGPPAYSKRTSSLNTAAMVVNTQVQKENEAPNRPGSLSTPASLTVSPNKDNEYDVLVLELVQAKTAEAQAKQEAEEAKAKLESLRKLLGMQDGAATLGHKSSPSQPNLLKRTNTMNTASMTAGSKLDPTVGSVSATVGGFWGGWGKKTG
jgi:chromosome segregation ATPase